MAADIVPIRLGLTKGDLYTLWAPRWRDAGDEWEALLGKDEDLYGFESVAACGCGERSHEGEQLDARCSAAPTFSSLALGEGGS